MNTTAHRPRFASRRIALARRAVAAVLAAGIAVGAVASSAGAIVLDTDRPKISEQELDFGLNWVLGAPVNGGHLDWDVTNGIVDPTLTGNLYINNASGTCARMQLEYHDANHNALAIKNGGLKCASDGSLHTFPITLSPFGSAFTTHVVVRLQVQNTNGTFSTTGSVVEYLD